MPNIWVPIFYLHLSVHLVTLETCLFDFENQGELSDFKLDCDGQKGDWYIDNSPGSDSKSLTCKPGSNCCMKSVKTILLRPNQEVNMRMYASKPNWSGQLELEMRLNCTTNGNKKPSWNFNNAFGPPFSPVWTIYPHSFTELTEPSSCEVLLVMYHNKDFDVFIDYIEIIEPISPPADCYAVARPTTTTQLPTTTTTTTTSFPSTTTTTTTTSLPSTTTTTTTSIPFTTSTSTNVPSTTITSTYTTTTPLSSTTDSETDSTSDGRQTTQTTQNNEKTTAGSSTVETSSEYERTTETTTVEDKITTSLAGEDTIIITTTQQFRKTTTDASDKVPRPNNGVFYFIAIVAGASIMSFVSFFLCMWILWCHRRRKTSLALNDRLRARNVFNKEF